MKPIKIILVFVLFATHLIGQELKYIRKAEKATDKAEYTKALDYYRKAQELNSSLPDVNKAIGVLLGEYMEHYEEAIPYLEKALQESNSDTITSVYYTLGKCYHYMGEYKKAISFYSKLKEYNEVGNPMFPIFLQKRISDCEYALTHPDINFKQSVKNIGEPINTRDPEYVPLLVNENQFIFTSKRKDTPKEKINSWDGKYFESMYISRLEKGRFSEPQLFQPIKKEKKEFSFFKKYNESNVSLSPDKNVLFIYQDGNLYETSLNGNTGKAKKLSKNINIARYQNHASLSPNNKTIFFSSESRQGIGGTDIFMSVKDEKGEWSKPELLDTTINTIFNEDAPFISGDGTLYFSSSGHPGYGGYDVYKSHLENGHWSKAENLGQPINSPGQDIFFSLIDATSGYYSSSRTGGYGDMDIYSINLNAIIPTDSLSKQLAFADSIAKSKLPGQDSVISTLYLPENELKKLNWNSTPLNFNYNDFTVRNDAAKVLDQNIEILNKNPELNIAINGFSDSRGPEKYNKYLSENRAIAVKKYLLQKGINIKRIKKLEGFGEKGLINICSDGVECSEDQHQQNRRVEIKIFNNNFKNENPVAASKQK